MHFFYIPDLHPDLTELSQEESFHALRVLRVKEGELIELTNGKGLVCRAIVTEAAKRCRVSIVAIQEVSKPDPGLHIAVAVPKNQERLEWFAEKASEIGITRIIPLLTDHSERRVQKLDRLKKVVVAALKQSRQAWLPEIEELTPLGNLLGNEFEGQRFIAHCRDGVRRPLINSYSAGQHALILIGPEGDFSQAEVTDAIRSGFQPVSLGRTRLRTETAALVALHTLVVVNEE